MALAREISMSYRAKNIDTADFPNHKKIVRERQPAIVFFTIVARWNFDLCRADCSNLMDLWTAITEDTLPPRQTYEQCGEVTEDTSRPACYDHIFRRISAHSQKMFRG